MGGGTVDTVARSQSAVLPSMSVKRKVTVPEGRSGMVAPDARLGVVLPHCRMREDRSRRSGRERQRSPRPGYCPAGLRLGEAQPEALQGEPAALADDAVVEQPDIEQLAGRHDLHRERDVGRRGGRVAGRVVMDGDEGGGLLAHRVTEDLTLAS